MGKPKKRNTRRSKAKVKIKTKVYIGNPGKIAEMKIDSLQHEVDSLQKENKELKIKIKIKQ